MNYVDPINTLITAPITVITLGSRKVYRKLFDSFAHLRGGVASDFRDRSQDYQHRPLYPIIKMPVSVREEASTIEERCARVCVMKKGRKVQTSRLLKTSLALATFKWIHDPVSQLRGTLPI